MGCVHFKSILNLTFFLFVFAQVRSEVVISEFMPCNISTKLNEKNNYTGWVEFYNSDEKEFNLKGSTVYQYKKKGSLKWAFTFEYDCVVPADGYALVFFDKTPKDVSNPQQKGHAPFKVDTDGGRLELVTINGTSFEVSYPQMYPHLSFGVKNGEAGYMEPTPKKKNSTPYADISTSRCAKPTFSTLRPGVYDNIDNRVSISCATSNAKIYYTTDGSIPSSKSTLYEGAFDISNSAVVRAIAVKDDMLPSEILTGSFLSYSNAHSSCGNANESLVVSLTANKDHFYSDELGIYVVGSNGVEGEKSCIGGRANYNQEWDRPVNFEYFKNGEQKFSQEAEVAVMGGCSRKSDNKVKSLKITTGKKTGSTTYSYNPYPSDEKKSANVYASFQLRNGGNAYDAENVRVRDAFMQSIAMDMGNIDYQAFQPVGFYLNGSYKGLMGLRERTNKEYVFSNYGYDEDEIDLVALVENLVASSGDLTAYDRMVEFAQNNYDDDNFLAKMNNYLDIDEYLNYMIFEQFIVNTDWPGNNFKLWRHRAGGKFRCILYDTDFGFGLYGSGYPNFCDANNNMIEWCMGVGSQSNWGNADASSYSFTSSSRWKTVLFASLMQNEDFKMMYLTKSLMHLEKVFNYNNIQSKWNSIVNRSKTEYCATFSRELNDDGNGMLSFAKKRTSIVYEQLADFYNLTNELFTLTLSCENKQAGFLVNGVEIAKNSYSFSCMKGMPVKIEAVLPDGYVVKSWKVNDVEKKTKNLLETIKGEVVVKLTIDEESYEKPKIYINEVCSKNTILKDPDTESKPDWIELYNDGDEAVDVAGFFMSDVKTNPLLHRIEKGYTTSVIPAKGHLLLWADDNANFGPLHLGFKLSDLSGETITLSKVVRDSVLTIDSFSFPSVGENYSYGRIYDGAKTSTTFAMCSDGENMEATPGKPNGSADCDSIMKANSVNIAFRSNVNGMKCDVMTSNHQEKSITIPSDFIAKRGSELRIEPLISDDEFEYWKSSVSFPFVDNVLTQNTNWNYFYSDAAPSGDWRSIAYDDASWRHGCGRFGYAKSTDKRTYNTELDYGSSSDDKYLTAYFRTRLSGENIGDGDTLVLTLTYDDGAVVYFNGTELARYNLPEDSVVGYETCTNSYTDDITEKIIVPKALIKKGDNIVAVEAHQYNGQSSDMTFALNAEVRGTSNLIRDKVLTMNPENAMTLTLYTSNMTVEDESVELSAMLQVYPNPAADYVVVNCLDGIPSAVTIFDALGRPVLHSYPQTERFELELEYLKSGQYTLVIDASNKRYVRKLVIE